MSFPVRPCLFVAITSLGLAWGCSLNGQGEIPGFSGTSSDTPTMGGPNGDGITQPGVEDPGNLGAGGASAMLPDGPSEGGAAAATGGFANQGGAGPVGGAPAGGVGGETNPEDAGSTISAIPDAGPLGDTGPVDSEPLCDAGSCDAGAP